MGQKVDPRAFRLGILRGWRSVWFSPGRTSYRTQLISDLKIRRMLEKRVRTAGVAKIDIDRQAGVMSIVIHTSRPGIIIGRGGQGIDLLRADIAKLLPQGTRLELDVHEIRNPERYAALVAQQVAEQLEKRISFRRVLKKTIERVTAAQGVQGVKIMVSGRLDGADMSRREWLVSGKIPLHTLRADIDYAQANAYTTYSVIGVQVWLYRGDVFKTDEMLEKERREAERSQDRRPRGARPRSSSRPAGSPSGTVVPPAVPVTPSESATA